MIETNNYLINDFAYWILSERKSDNVYYDGRMEKKYIEEKCKKWNLRFYLKLFQDYTVICSNENDIESEKDILALFSKFNNERNSIVFIDQLSLSRKKIVLQPLFRELIDYLEDEKRLKQITSRMYVINKKFYNGDIDLGDWLLEIGREININNEFETFISNTINSYEVNDYLIWIRNKKKYYSKLNIDYNMYKTKFTYNSESLNSTISNIIRGESRRRVLYNMVHHSLDEFQILQDKEDYAQDFAYYLHKQGINMNKPFSNLGVEQLVNEYCENNTDIDKKKLLKSLLNTNDSILDKIKRALNKKNGKKFSLERIEKVKMHGFFMFADSHNLSGFLHKNFTNLHNLTGDILDIYYTNGDLKRNIDCYEKIKKFSYLKISEKCTPSFIVWDKKSCNIQTINLQKLEFEEIRMAIEKLVNLAETDEFYDCVNSIKEYVENLRQEKRPCIVNNAPIGQQNVGDSNTNSYYENINKN